MRSVRKSKCAVRNQHFARIAIVMLGLIARGAVAETPINPPPPNVLFLICDDLNCDLACYGNQVVHSPNIDRLAKRGLRFNQAHCQFPLCGPSRASFMAGLYPDQTLIHRNAIYLRSRIPNVTSMSQLFRKNGYFVTRIGKIYHYNVPAHMGTAGHDDPDSWDYTINPRGRDKDEEDQIFSLRPGSYGGTLSWLAADGTDEEQTDGIAATMADQMLKRFSKLDQPFFLAVGFYRPHTPYVAPKADFARYPAERMTVPQIPKGYFETLPAPARKWLTRKKEQHNLDPKLARQAIQAYYASITFVDRQVGRVLDSLKTHGLADNTIVVFTSDHGYHMGDHGYWQKTTLYDDATRVPLIISSPGMPSAGHVSQIPVELVDMYPTLADMASLDAPKYLAGENLVRLLKEPNSPIRSSALTQLGTGYSVRTGRYRYTEWGDAGGNGKELYDHQTDPAELVNLAGRSNLVKIQAELTSELHQRVEQARRLPIGVKQTPAAKKR